MEVIDSDQLNRLALKRASRFELTITCTFNEGYEGGASVYAQSKNEVTTSENVHFML